MRPSGSRPTDRELDILRVLWEHGRSTVRDVHEALSKGRDTGYTTTLKLMQIMAEKRLVHRDESRRTHVYTAALPREKMQKRLVSDLLDRAFSGSARTLVLSALSAKEVSVEELAEIRQLLDQLEEGRGDETRGD